MGSIDIFATTRALSAAALELLPPRLRSKSDYVNAVEDAFAQLDPEGEGELSLTQAEEKITTFDDWVADQAKEASPGRANAASQFQPPARDTGTSQRFTGDWNWCGIWGHKESECRGKKLGKPKKTIRTPKTIVGKQKENHRRTVGKP